MKQSLTHLVLGKEPRLQRLVMYWAITTVLYILCISLLWVNTQAGGASVMAAIWLSVWMLAGVLLFYALIRASIYLGLTPSHLAAAQGIHAIISVIGAYANVAPVRGAILTLLLVVLIFCAFALSSRRCHQLSAFALTSLGLTMAWMVKSNPKIYPLQVEAMHFILAASMLIVVVFLTGQFNYLRERLKKQKADLTLALSRIELLATQDELTSLPNRWYMKEVLSSEELRQRTQETKLCIALIEIDYFKSINDRYGHAVGDKVLQTFAECARAALRRQDVLSRWGGEEFLLLLPNTAEDEAIRVLERMKQRIAHLRFDALDPALRLTFSAGLSSMERNESTEQVILRADKAMFRAKAEGRNMVQIFDDESAAQFL